MGNLKEGDGEGAKGVADGGDEDDPADDDPAVDVEGHEAQREGHQEAQAPLRHPDRPRDLGTT